MILFLSLLNIALAAPALDFQSALDQILEKNTEIQIQKSRVNASEYQLTASKLVFLPTFGLEATYDQDDDMNYSATAKWNLFRFGSDKAGLNSSSKNYESEKYKLQSVVLASESTAVLALLKSIQKTLQAQILEKNIENRQKYLDIANQRYKKSYLPKEEVDKVQLDLSNTEARLKDVQAERVEANAALEALSINAEVKPLWPWKEKILQQKNLISTNRNADIHPQYKAQQLSAEKENQKALQLKRRIWPSIDLSYSYLIADAQNTKAESWEGLVTLSIPLFDGFQDWSNYKVQKEIAYISDLQKNQTKKDVESSQFEAQEKFKLALETAQAREKNLEIARKLYQSNLARFRMGRADANELSIDENRLIESELNSLEGWAQAHISYMNLKHSFGETIR